MAVIESASRLISLRCLLKPWTPVATTVRWRTRKPNIQRPIPDHYLKARFKAALAPIYPDPAASKPWFEVCGNLVNQSKKEEEYKYERLLADQLHSRFADSKLIGIFQENSTKAHERIRIKGMLHGQSMRIVYGSKKVATMALVNTEFEPILRLHIGMTCYMCCKEIEVAKMLKFARRMPTYLLLGGMVQGKLLTRNQLTWCSTLPDINTLRAELCSILSSPAMRISQSLVHHQQSLTRSLDEHVRRSTPNPENNN